MVLKLRKEQKIKQQLTPKESESPTELDEKTKELLRSPVLHQIVSYNARKNRDGSLGASHRRNSVDMSNSNTLKTEKETPTTEELKVKYRRNSETMTTPRLDTWDYSERPSAEVQKLIL